MNLAVKEKKKTAEVRRRGSGAQRVYEELKRDILCLDLKPSDLLDESALSQKFGMSRSPVREALIRLSMEGLVVTLPNKSTLVAPLGLEEFQSYLDALDLVQRVTTRLAARLRTQADLKAIIAREKEYKKARAVGNVSDMIESNLKFHMAISNAARNKYLDFLHARLLDDGRRMLHLYFRSFGDAVPESTEHDHDLIVKAIRNQDEDLAESHAHDHVMGVGKQFLGYLGAYQLTDFKLSV